MNSMEGKPELMSKRLRFDRWRECDFPLLYELHADPRVQVGYSSGPEAWTQEGIRRRLTDYMVEQEQLGVTKWKLSLLDGTFIGRAGWSRWGNDDLEIGYAIKPEFQGQGYALEAAESLISWALTNRPERLIGFALVGNDASRHILSRAQMVYEGDRSVNGVPNAFYALNR